MAKNIVGFIIAIAVSIICIATIMIPIVESTSDEVTATEYNGQTVNSIRMNYGTPSDNLKVEKLANESTINMYLGDSETPYYSFPLNTDGYTAWALVTSTFSYGITGGAAGSVIDYTARNSAGSSGSTNHYGVDKDFTAIVNVTTGEITVNTAGGTYNFYGNCDVTKIYWADPNGEYINVDTASTYKPIYIEDTKDVIGSLMIGGNYVFWESTDNVEVTGENPATLTTTTTQTERGLYELNSLGYSVTGTDDTVRTGAMSHCIVKYKVEGDPLPNGDAIAQLIHIIPLMLIVAILVMAVSMIAFKNRD